MKTGVIFGRVTSKGAGTKDCLAAGKPFVYTFSTGTKFYTKADLKPGAWYFVKTQVNDFGIQTAISYKPLPEADGEEMQRAYAELKTTAHEAEKMWKRLGKEDRMIVARTLGMGLTGLGAASAGLGAAEGIGAFLFEECLLSGVTGGLSLVIGGVLAGLTVLQYEERKEALAFHMNTIEAYNRLRKRLSDQLAMHLPAQYRTLQPLDPQAVSIVGHSKYFISNFSWQDLLKSNPEEDYEFSFA